MKSSKLRMLLLFMFLGCMLFINIGCSKVPAGHVGVKVYLIGSDKGVDNEILSPGRYWIGYNEDLFLFPTFQQTTTWTADGAVDQSLIFQTVEGLSVNADIGISYTIDASKVPTLFQTYRKGIDEITDIYLRNLVRDALVIAASDKNIEDIYGKGKQDLINQVKNIVSTKMEPIGINIDMISFVGDLRLPDSIVSAINAKIAATQKAQQRENELREAEADAQKKIAAAKGEAESLKAMAKAKADSTLIEAEAQAKSNKLLSDSITPTLVEYLKITTWDGKLPKVSGGTPLINIPLSK